MHISNAHPRAATDRHRLDLSLDSIVVRRPTLDAPALVSSVFDALAP